jgi:hypothetical protein
VNSVLSVATGPHITLSVWHVFEACLFRQYKRIKVNLYHVVNTLQQSVAFAEIITLFLEQYAT